MSEIRISDDVSILNTWQRHVTLELRNQCEFTIRATLDISEIDAIHDIIHAAIHADDEPEPAEVAEKCLSCEYIDGHESNPIYRCRRKSPRLFQMGTDEHRPQWGWPILEDTKGCGEHHPADPVDRGPELCEECDKYIADHPSKLCAGCNAYKEHQDYSP